jgi:hydrogenase maturation protease
MSARAERCNPGNNVMILLICYGNPLRGDDGTGWEIARDWQGGTVPAHIRVEVRQQLTIELAAPISRAGRVVFVDARTTGYPGEISCVRLDPAESPISPWAHAVHPGMLLALSRKIYGRVPEAVVCSVTGLCVALGAPMSSEVRRALPALSALVRDVVTAGGSAACFGA